MSSKTPRQAKAGSNNSDVLVRMYAVGFGDAFLVIIPGKERPMRVLIDCGSIAKHLLAMDDIVTAIIDDCRDQDGVPRIDVVVATHRHRDHISGFASPRWAEVEVGEVWMSWTEHPTNPSARHIRQQQVRLAEDLGIVAGLADPENADVSKLNRYAVMALNAAPNQNSMRTLHEGFSGGNARRLFLPETTKFPEPVATEVLPGVKAFVLGPSTDEKIIRSMDPPRTESYLRAVANPALPEDSTDVFGSEWWVEEEEYRSVWSHLWLSSQDRERIESLSESNEGTLAVALDKAINGTSLVLVLAIGEAYLLFPGDAQWGTWERMLGDANVCDLLRRTSLLKVGHHGSHNATPCSFIESILPDHIHAMVSTRKVAKWPDIPRLPLLEAMEAKGLRIARSDKDEKAPSDAFVIGAQHRYVEASISMLAGVTGKTSRPKKAIAKKAAKRATPAKKAAKRAVPAKNAKKRGAAAKRNP